MTAAVGIVSSVDLARPQSTGEDGIRLIPELTVDGGTSSQDRELTVSRPSAGRVILQLQKQARHI